MFSALLRIASTEWMYVLFAKANRIVQAELSCLKAHARRSKMQANVYEQSEYDSEPKRFCALAQNEHQFGQIGAKGDEEKVACFSLSVHFLFFLRNKKEKVNKRTMLSPLRSITGLYQLD